MIEQINVFGMNKYEIEELRKIYVEANLALLQTSDNNNLLSKIKLGTSKRKINEYVRHTISQLDLRILNGFMYKNDGEIKGIISGTMSSNDDDKVCISTLYVKPSEQDADTSRLSLIKAFSRYYRNFYGAKEVVLEVKESEKELESLIVSDGFVQDVSEESAKIYGRKI